MGGRGLIRAAIAACLLASGCARPIRERIVVRLIPEDPQGFFDPDDLYALEPTYRADVPFTAVRPSARGGVAWDVELRGDLAPIDAATVDVLEVRMPGPAGVGLYWAPAGARFTEARNARTEARDPSEPHRYVVSRSPQWAGTVSRLSFLWRFQPQIPPPPVVAIRGFRRRYVPDRLAEAVARAHRVTLLDDTRPALLAPAGLPVERKLVVPPGSRLELDYAVLSRGTGPVAFAVSVIGSAGRPRTVLEKTIKSSASSEWRSATVDLRPFAGRSVTLRLETGGAPSADGLPAIAVWGNPRILAADPGPLRPSVVLVSIDTLRADRLSLYGYGRPTSPRIDAWARRRGVTFRDAVAQAPWTLPSHTSMFTGLDAVHHGVNHLGPVPPSLRLMAEDLREAGYETLAATGDGWLNVRFGFVQGFDVYRARKAWVSELHENLEWAIERVGALARRPFFLFFHTYEVHAPHVARRPYYERVLGKEETGDPYLRVGTRWENGGASPDGLPGRQSFLRLTSTGKIDDVLPSARAHEVSALYDSGVAYTDERVGRLLAALEPIRGETLVVLTSDHGESLGEGGRVAHGYLTEENLRVPLVFAFPDGLAAGRFIESQVRSIDIYPTVLERAGLPAAAGIDGTSLMGLVRGGAARVPSEAWSYAAGGAFGLALRVDGRFKYRLNDTVVAPARGAEGLYVVDGAPADRRPVSAPVERLAGLRERAEQHLARGSGLWIELSNGEDRPLEIRLRGEAVVPNQTKSPDTTSRATVSVRQGALDVVVPPGTRYRLLLEEPAGESLGMSGGFTGGARFAETLSLAPPRTTGTVALEGGRFAAVWGPGRPASPATGARIAWSGPERHAPGSAPTADPALREQLRALGYLQ